MATVKINNKKYDVPKLTFKHLTIMEEQGISLSTAFRKNQIFVQAMAFTCCVADVDRDEAERLLEQHVLGGGSLNDIVNAFGEALLDSAFFRKMLNLDENEGEQKSEKTEKNEVSKENETTAG